MRNAAAHSSTPLPEVDRNKLSGLIASEGETQAARLLDISRQTLGRCLAGLPIQRGTASHVRLRLGGIEASRAAEPRGAA
jgi:hypothetical protein